MLLGSIEFRLRVGWSFDAEAREFVGPKGQRVAAEGLPRSSKVLFKVPSLQERPVAELSAPEKKLLRSMQAILPAGVEAKDYLEVVQSWAAVEDVSLPPEISLPRK
jgi:hypothetical protein